MSQHDMVMQEITEGVQRGRAGDREGARLALAAVWDRLGQDGDPLHLVTLAHFMADLQNEAVDELAWDHRALAAADRLTDQRAQRYEASLSVRGLYPSLYASLAADYAKLNDVAAAQRYLTRAEAAIPERPEGEYGEYVQAEIARLRAQLDDDSDRPSERP